MSRRFVCLFLLAAIAPWLEAAKNSPLTLRYAIVSNGATAGSEVDSYTADRQVDTYEFNDRGRGPKISAHYVLAPDGTVLRADLTGVDYLKAPVDEHFAVDGWSREILRSTAATFAADVW
jgi:hypothetical protein